MKAGAEQGSRHDRPQILKIFDWFLRPWHYFNTKPRAVAYLIACSGFYGGALFVIGSFAGCSPAVSVLAMELLAAATISLRGLKRWLL